MSEPIVVPDFPGALVGWRCWGLGRTHAGIRLASHGGTLWPADAPLEAECGSGKAHTPPGAKCTCGIYALNRDEGVPYYRYDGRGYAAFGEVYVWGEVVRGTMGYRARYAYPKALYLAHKDWRFVRPLRDAYNVPVRLKNPYSNKDV